jgi:thymidine kinase
MFAGKSTHLITALRKLNAINIQALVVKPKLDDRYSAEGVCSHDRIHADCYTCNRLTEVYEHPEYIESKVVIIEEGQFFDDIVDFVKQACDTDKKHIIVYGLSGDFERKPIGKITELVPLANKIQKLYAYCHFCKDSTIADFTVKEHDALDSVFVGGLEIYKPVCRKHYLEKTKVQ